MTDKLSLTLDVDPMQLASAYGPVNRAIAAGLIVARSGKGNAYALYVRGAEPYTGIPIQISHRGVGVTFSIGC